MFKLLIKSKVWLLAPLLLGLSACQSTSITNVWSEANPKPYTSMVVMAAYPEENVRRTIEDKLVNALIESNVDASAFYRLYPNVENFDESELKTLFKNSSAQSVLTIKQIKLEHRVNIQTLPSFGFYGYGPFYGNGWYGYTEPIVTPYTVAKLEINLWDIQTQKLVWSASSEATNPDKIAATAESLAKTTIKSLQKQGWIMTPAKK